MIHRMLSRRMDAKHLDSSHPNQLGAAAPRRFGATNLLFLVHSPWQNWCICPRANTVYIPEWLTAWPLWCPPPPPILDDRKWISIAFLAISEKIRNFDFFSQNGCRRPFWMTDHISIHFQINTQFLFFFIFFTKWLPAAILDDRKSLSIAFLTISNQYATFIFHKMAAGGHFGWPATFILFTKWLPAAILDDRKSLSIAFLTISDQYATFFFTKWLPAAILDDRKSLSIAFLAISDQYATFILFTKWLPAAILDDRKSLSIAFSPFQINMQLLFFFTKWLPAAILDDRKSLMIAFLTISDQYATLIFFFTKWLSAAILDDRKSLSNAFLTISDQYATFYFATFFFFKMAAGGHFGSPIWAILDDRKSLSIAFLAISDQYTTLFFEVRFAPKKQ